ncbi:MAG: hypothetical protein V4505_21775 [Pseudomonadota bacterium]
MKSVVIWPFRIASAGRVATTPWTTFEQGGFVPLPEVVPGLDYSSVLEVRRTVRIDVDGLRADCGLPGDAELALSTSWHSAGTALRRPISNMPLPCTGAKVEVEVAGQVSADAIAQYLTLHTKVVLARALIHDDRTVARYPGSALWEDLQKVTLDSVTSLFPVELVDLPGSAWAQPDAGWILSWNTYELERPFLGSVRLYVNSKHTEVAKAVVGPVLTRDAQVMRQAIYFDVARSLVLGSLHDSEFILRSDEYPPDSIGRVVRDIIQRLWPGEELSGLRSTAETSPEHFNAELQARLGIFRT